MRRVLLAMVIGTAALLGAVLFAQTQPSTEDARKAEIVKLFHPMYPPLARQARITGEVRISLYLRRDGTVESAEVIDGHPMLKQAALESIQKSVFVCGECTSAGGSYLVTYDFELREGCHFGPNCESLDSDQTLITQSRGRVVVFATPMCECDPSIARIRFRSSRCLYLWKCGHRDISND